MNRKLFKYLTSNQNSKQTKLIGEPNTVYGAQSDTSRKEKTKVEIYQLMMELLKKEQQAVERVQLAEREVNDISMIE